jgi:L-fuconolactonase
VIVDAHQHLWTADYAWLSSSDDLAPIRRDYTVDDLRSCLAAAGVDRTVLVEAARCTPDETYEFLATALATPEIAGVVGWASLTDPALRDTIEGYRAAPGGHLLVGIRDQVQGRSDDYLMEPAVHAGLRTIADLGLVNELVVTESQLPSVVFAATSVASTFVLDHLGKPRSFATWQVSAAQLAALPNVVAKLSGLVTEVDDIRPYVLEAVDLFGPERLMFGSDWPVCELVSSYVEVKDRLEAALGGRPAPIFAGTAIDTYGLELTR